MVGLELVSTVGQEARLSCPLAVLLTALLSRMRCTAGFPIHRHRLQYVDWDSALRSPPLLLRNKGPSSPLQTRPQVCDRQDRDLLCILAR